MTKGRRVKGQRESQGKSSNIYELDTTCERKERISNVVSTPRLMMVGGQTGSLWWEGEPSRVLGCPLWPLGKGLINSLPTHERKAYSGTSLSGLSHRV